MLREDQSDRNHRGCRLHKNGTSAHHDATSNQPLDAPSRRETFEPAGIPLGEDPAFQFFLRSVLSEDALQLEKPDPVPPIDQIERETGDLAALGELVLSGRMAAFTRKVEALFRRGEMPTSRQLALVHQLFAERFGTRREEVAL